MRFIVLGSSGLPQRGREAVEQSFSKALPLRSSAPLRLIRARIIFPLLLNPLGVRFAVEDEKAVFGDVGFAGVDGPVAVLRGGDAELRVLGIQTQRLREAEVAGMHQDRHAGGCAIDHAADVDPFAFGGVTSFAVVTLTGEHGDGFDGIPREVPAHTEAAVVILGQFQRLLARAGLRAREVDDVGERAIKSLL